MEPVSLEASKSHSRLTQYHSGQISTPWDMVWFRHSFPQPVGGILYAKTKVVIPWHLPWGPRGNNHAGKDFAADSSGVHLIASYHDSTQMLRR